MHSESCIHTRARLIFSLFFVCVCAEQFENAFTHSSHYSLEKTRVTRHVETSTAWMMSSPGRSVSAFPSSSMSMSMNHRRPSSVRRPKMPKVVTTRRKVVKVANASFENGATQMPPSSSSTSSKDPNNSELLLVAVAV